MDIVETSQVQPGNYEELTLPELYDLLAEQTVMFNKHLLLKAAKDEFKDLKKSIKYLQEEIKRRREI